MKKRVVQVVCAFFLLALMAGCGVFGPEKKKKCLPCTSSRKRADVQKYNATLADKLVNLEITGNSEFG